MLQPVMCKMDNKESFVTLYPKHETKTHKGNFAPFSC